MSALAWFSPRSCLKAHPSQPPSRWGGGGGIHLCYQPSTGSGPGGPERRAGLSGTSKLAEGGAGPAGGRAGKLRGAGALFGAGAVARPAPARLSAGSRVFRERLPWVTRLRGDTALPSPSGNLSIREIDNPQRRAAHSLRSPSLWGSPAQGGATCPRKGGLGGREMSGPFTHPEPGLPQLLGDGGDQKRFRGAAWRRLPKSEPFPWRLQDPRLDLFKSC